MGATLASNIKPKSVVAGDCADAAGFRRGQMQLTGLDLFPLDITSFRKFDSVDLGLPAAATGSYLGLVTGTIGSNSPQLRTSDSKNTSVTQKGRRLVTMPNLFAAAGSALARFRVRAGMMTTVASASATLAVAAYAINPDGTVGSNLVSTSAQNINSLSLADFEFTFDPSALAAGDRLDVQTTIAIVDVATGTAVIGVIQNFILRCDVQP